MRVYSFTFHLHTTVIAQDFLKILVLVGLLLVKIQYVKNKSCLSIKAYGASCPEFLVFVSSLLVVLKNIDASRAIGGKRERQQNQ
jgi:hypothetical protein